MLLVSDISTNHFAFLKAFFLFCALLTPFFSSHRAAYADGYDVFYTAHDAGINVKGSSTVYYYHEDNPFASGCGAEIAFSGPAQSNARPPSASPSLRLADATKHTNRFRLAGASDRVANLGGPISTTLTWQGSSSPPAAWSWSRIASSPGAATPA